MSKANPPSPNSEPDPAGMETNEDFPLEAAGGAQKPTLEDMWEDWQTIDFPNALSVDAIARSTDAARSAEAEPPQVAELVTLIQELNECNDTLLDRVAQLEAALEQNQTALQVEAKRSQMNVEPQVLAAAQEQVTQLLDQLEFSHQASQRQQILVETLSEQFESSQERVAQLERECSAIQQRCNEQSQQLMESENACRDLRTRLQRQQRYTLQFKVALEKCLEVQPPSYETAGDVAAPNLPGWSEPATQPFLPKAAKIQPWSSHPQFLGVAQVAEASLSIVADRALPASFEEPPSRLPVSPSQPDDIRPTASEWLSSEELAAQPPLTNFPLDTHLEPAEIQEALRIEGAIGEAQLESIEAIDSSPALVQPQMTAETVTQPDAVDGGEGAASPAEAEDNLWQDLARLIEVSTEDVIRAKSAEDFAEFAAQPIVSDQALPSAVNDLKTDDLADDLWGNFPQLPKSAELPDEVAVKTPVQKPKLKLPGVTLDAPSNSPSPVVYPLRPKRKLQSLAAVDLPTFPR